MLSRPSRHLSWDELACNDGTPYPIEWRDTRALNLASVFEIIRHRCGNEPITVISGFRTPYWNRLAKGARKSQHLQGQALDMRAPHGMTVREFYNKIKVISVTVHDIGGIGLYGRFVHFDIRKRPASGRLAMWRSDALKEDLFVG